MPGKEILLASTNPTPVFMMRYTCSIYKYIYIYYVNNIRKETAWTEDKFK